MTDNNEQQQQQQQQPERTTSSAYPAPPPFYKHFTSDNVTALKTLRENASQSPSDLLSTSLITPPSTTTSHIPHDLSYLIPPKPPTTGSYQSFGDRWNVCTAQ